MPRNEQPRINLSLLSGCLATIGSLCLVLLVVLPAHADDEADARTRLANMTAAEKEDLRQRRERFERLPADEQQRLRDLHAALASAPDGDRLRRIMQRYDEWLKTLASGQRADLLAMPAEQRVAEIKKLRDDQARERLRRLVATRLTSDDARAIFAWLGELVKSHESELLAAMPPDQRADYNRITDERLRRWRLIGTLRGALNADSLNIPTVQDIDSLVTRLSDEPKKALTRVGDAAERRRVVKEWVGAAMMNRFVLPPVSAEDLKKYYDELDAKQRSYLESLAPDQLNEELRRLYYASRFRKEHEGKWGPPRPGSGGPFGPPGGGRRGDRDGEKGDGRGPGGGPRPPNGDKGPRPPMPPPPPLGETQTAPPPPGSDPR